MKKSTPILLALLLSLTATTSVQAGGYDTPILYSARHMGMGGTAIGYVDDPSALFHNPAGLSHTRFISLTADFSPLFGTLQSTPELLFGPAENEVSETAFAPFFLVGGSFRVTDWMTLGIGAYPVASAGATYKYKNEIASGGGTDVFMEDMTKLVFIEVSPGVSFDLPGNIRIGVGYRFSIVKLDRLKESTNGALTILDLKLSGINFAGLRAGIQWQPIPDLQLGVTYRHKTETIVEADSSTVLTAEVGKTTMDVVLPSKLGVGVRYDVGPMGLACDFEWGFNSQNDATTIKGEGLDGGKGQELPVPYKWSDAMTVRVGTEYRFLENYRLRAGYIFDDKTGNEKYPTAFGTPPTPTHTLTAGFGYKSENWETNLAYAYRMGSVKVDPPTGDPDAKNNPECPACSYAGEYKIQLHGVYADFSWYFD